MWREWEDAYGHALWDYLNGKGGFEIVERDDGFFDVAGGPKFYFSQYDEWPEHEKRAMEFVRGRVLDIGCGAGRHSLYLQERDFDVTCIDISPLAIKVCRERGIKKAYVMSITRVSRRLGVFDTILLLGNNFGLFANFRRARWLLRRFYTMTSDIGRIIAESRDPYETDEPAHIAYHRWNIERGRMGGQIRIRIRYKKYVTPWFDYLLVSKDEMESILENTGWTVYKYLDGESGMYIAIIDKEG
jgi:SAM-dependent methyltransferase